MVLIDPPCILSLGGDVPYVVVDLRVRVVVKGHGGREVFVIGKSGLFRLVFTALKLKLSCWPDCLNFSVKTVYFPSKKKGEEQLLES